jgi:hypothetical protein
MMLPGFSWEKWSLLPGLFHKNEIEFKAVPDFSDTLTQAIQKDHYANNS